MPLENSVRDFQEIFCRYNFQNEKKVNAKKVGYIFQENVNVFAFVVTFLAYIAGIFNHG